MLIIKKTKFLKQNIIAQRGASMLEVILAIALCLMLIPFMYYQIADMNNAVKDVAVANKIVKLEDNVIDYFRAHQSDFASSTGDAVAITDEELSAIAPDGPVPDGGWALVRNNVGGSSIEVYLAFSLGSEYRAANIAKYIGTDAAIVRSDNIAYSNDWAVAMGEGFNPGDLVFKITHDFGEADNARFLHRSKIDFESDLNRMERDLNMDFNNIYNVQNIQIPSTYWDPGSRLPNDPNCEKCGADFRGANALLLNLGSDGVVNTENVAFTQGAKLKSESGMIANLQVHGAISGFKTVNTNNLTLTGDNYLLPQENITLTYSNPPSDPNYINKKFIYIENGDLLLRNPLDKSAKRVYFGVISAKLVDATRVENSGKASVDQELIISSDDAVQSEDAYYENPDLRPFVVGGGYAGFTYGLYKSSGKIIAPPLVIPQGYEFHIGGMEPNVFQVLNNHDFNSVAADLKETNTGTHSGQSSGNSNNPPETQGNSNNNNPPSGDSGTGQNNGGKDD